MATDSALELDGQAEDWHCQQVHRQGDEDDADDIETKATLDHLANLDVTRAIGNGVRRGGNWEHECAGCREGHRNGEEKDVDIAIGSKPHTHGDATHNRNKRSRRRRIGGDLRQEEHQRSHGRDDEDNGQDAKPLGHFTNPQGQAGGIKDRGQRQATAEEQEDVPRHFIGRLPVQQTDAALVIRGEDKEQDAGGNAHDGIVVVLKFLEHQRQGNPGCGGEDEDDAGHDLGAGPRAASLSRTKLRPLIIF